MSSALYVLLLFSALWTLSLCGTRQFHLVNEQKTWTEAQSYCREKFTDLATIESQQEMDALIAVLIGTGGHFWIGLRQTVQQDSRSWTWSDGRKSSYTYWNTGEPNDGVGDNCVGLWDGPAYRWTDEDCQWPNPFICYEEAVPLILINQNKTWREALWYCRENHVDLVSVHTEEVQQWVEVITKNTSTANVWMGLRHTCSLNLWFWVSGEFMCYQNWAPGDGTWLEDCSGGERTGAVQSGSKQWVSLPETQTLNFICSVEVMSSALYVLLLFSALWALSSCVIRHFHVVNEKKTWTGAQSYCREKFTDLATIEDQQEMDAVKAALNGAGGNFWIGLRQAEEQNIISWTWSDGRNFSYRYWGRGEPNNDGSDNCGILLSDQGYRWNDLGCSYEDPFICYKAVPLILINQNKTWRDALKHCRDNKLDLVSVHTRTVQQWVETATKNASTANVWMGLRHTCILNIWYWVSGESMCYQNWAPGNGTGVEDCSGGERTGAVQSGSKQWVSLPETQTLNFICSVEEF
ncbi:hypothetical protein NFI96_010912 [Prochilodus magdalenae]|nr:hypothetical protein NFI96_010912 [Prochilodus magdalenae]